MLKRAVCTIYMVQETDTLGKDSELAATLAQGKPVIAYVPKIDPDPFAKVIAARPLEYVRLRILDLYANGTLEQVPTLSETAQSFLTDFRAHRMEQPFELWTNRDAAAFKQRKPYWGELCRLLAHAEMKAFERRADVLKKYHPLAMQMDLKTGVANGVMVVRSPQQCATLLKAILTNEVEFEICVEPGCRTLVEKMSESVFRVVTDNEKLTNSFWNFWDAR